MPIPVEKWGPKQCRELYDRMTRLGPDNCVLELRHYGMATEDGHGNGHLRVVDTRTGNAIVAGSEPSDINESIWCPPIC